MNQQTTIPEDPMSFLEFSSVLVFATHPGDETIACAGLLALCKRLDIPVRIVFVSSGESKDDEIEQQSRDACRLLGIESIDFWHESSGRIDYNEQLIEHARKIMFESSADLILAPSTRETHPDRCAMAWVVIEASRRSLSYKPERKIALYEVEIPLTDNKTVLNVAAEETQKRSASACYQKQNLVGQVIQATEAFRILDSDSLSHPVLIDRPMLSPRVDSARSAQYAKVSVLIRSIGRACLQRALDSIALQTWPAIEIVLLNAKGPDHPELNDHSSQVPLRLIDSDRPLSRTEAANRLLESADGDYALFLDDDDWLAPDHIAHLVARLEQNPEAMAAYAGVEYGRLIDERWLPEHLYNATFDPFRLLFENFLPIHAVLFRLEFVRDRAGCRFDTALDVFEDWDFWLQISEHGPMIETGHVSAYYLFNEQDGSGTHPTAERQISIEKLRRKWLKRLSEDRLLELLDYLQQTYRNSSFNQQIVKQQQCEKHSLNEEMQALREILIARNTEIDNYREHSANLESIIKAREEEIQNYQQEIQNLRNALTTLRDATKDRAWLMKKLLKPGMDHE
ncbi:MAG: hypothetical protein Kow0065_03620 [Methylomicrobium sp.]